MTDSARRSALERRTGRHLWRGMVNWFDPRLLFRTLFALVVARLFAAYADRRERDTGRPDDGPYAYDGDPELWLDYVADLGDGWNATASIAALLAEDSLAPAGEVLPHGRVLVMGGDQVYPVASREEYLCRLEAPYYSLHPWSPPERPRDLYVLPGNHDWYDGLAAFSRLFLQGRWFAGWRTRQSRSYFVLRLPQRWWLVAVDVQLDNDIDAPQLQYLLDATAGIAPGDAVIIAGAVPYWLEEGDSTLHANIRFLERRLVRERGAQVRLALAGDLHHYARYAAADGGQRVTSGGGGAFLHGTAWQPERIEDGGRTFRWAASFPQPGASRAMLWRLFAFPVLNWPFALFLGALATLLLWGVDASSHGMFFSQARLGVLPAVGSLLVTAVSSPWPAALTAGWFAAFVAYADEPRSGGRIWRECARTLLGMTHGLLQLLLALGVLAWLTPAGLDQPLLMLAGLGAIAVVSGAGGGLLFGAWLWITYQLFGCHRDTAFSACRIADWKHFLRLHVGADGTLTVHVIGLPRICRRWRVRHDAAPDAPRAGPADGVGLASRAVLVDRFTIRP